VVNKCLTREEKRMEQPSIDPPDFRSILTRAVVAPLLIMALLAGTLLWQIDNYRAATRAIIQTDRTIAQANVLQRLLVDMEAGLRGYLLTGIDAFLDPYNVALVQISPTVDLLTPRLANQPTQAGRLRQTLQDYSQWQQYATKALQLRRTGGDYTSLVASGTGKQIMDNIRLQLGDLLQDEEARRDMLVQSAQRTTQIVVYGSLGLALIVGALLAFYSRRQLLLLAYSYQGAFALARERASQVIEQRERLRVTLASIGDGVIVTDTDGKITFANPVAQALTGWAQEDAQGQPLEQVFAIINEESRTQAENPVAKVLRDGTVVRLANHTILIARNGAEMPIDDSAAPIRDADGQIVGVVLVFRNITERKRTEDALRDSEERFRAVFDHSPIGIGLARGGSILSGNEAFLQLFGYADMAELRGHPLTDLIAPSLRAEIADRTIKRQQGIPQPTAYETIGLRGDGSEFPFSVNVSQIVLPEGSTVVAFCTDISERRHADLALRASEQRYRDLADAMPLVVWTARPSGELDYYNRRWFDYTGLTLEQSQSWGWEPVLHPDDLQTYLDRWNESVRTGSQLELEYRWKRADGIYRWHLGRALAVRNAEGRIAYWVGTGTDIEEQKQAEDQQRLLAEASVLLVSSLDYEQMLTQLTRLVVPRLADWCAIHVLEDGVIRRLAFTHVDPAKQALVGDRPERYPLDPSAQHIVSHVLRSGEPELYSDVPDELLVEAARDAEHLQTLRTLVFQSYMCLPMVARGYTLGTITLVTAESGRRYGQAELAFGEDLASRAAIALDNARLYRDAQAAVRARDQFLSIASHELKTPLTSLMGYIDLMQRRAARAGDQTDRDQRAMQVVGEQAARLNKLVTALLDLSRIETGQLSIERGLVDLNALARRLVEETQPTTNRHTITFSGDKQPIMILGDELRLEQVIQNLIQNAIKYSPGGGTVAVLASRQDTTAYLHVSDQGIGIPGTALPQLFRRFYRAPNADSQHISGMGIGLYVVKEIIELHGGTVDVASQERQGSTFTISLPLLQIDQGRRTKDE
jgi:PAS domain S-box-containing protein